MSLFLKIMIIVGFGIFTVSGVHSQEEDFLHLPFVIKGSRTAIQDNNNPPASISSISSRRISKEKLNTFIVDQVDMVARAYDFVVEAEVQQTKAAKAAFEKIPDFLIFTVETNEGLVYTGIKCWLRFRGKLFLSSEDMANPDYRDNLKIYFKDCKNSEVVFSKTSISVDFDELKYDPRTLME